MKKSKFEVGQTVKFAKEEMKVLFVTPTKHKEWGEYGYMLDKGDKKYCFVLENEIKPTPDFEKGDIVEWGDFIGKVLFVTPTADKSDKEYRYVLRLIRDRSGKNISGLRYVFVFEGVLDYYDYKSN